MKNICYCPECGNIAHLAFSEYVTCEYCGHSLIATQYPRGVESLKEGTLDLKPEIRQAIEECINNNPDFSEESKQMRLDKERSERIHGTYTRSKSSVKCPYCKSSNVSKISTASRAVSVGLFGITSGKIGKQWHCNNCKSDF